MSLAWPFSVAAELATPGSPAARLRRALRATRQFLERSVWSLIDQVVADQARRDLLAATTRDVLHVGFLFLDAKLDATLLAEAARAAGFGGPHQWFPSTVVARELALLAGQTAVPTQVFRAETESSACRFVEVFVPALPPGAAPGWLDIDVSSHVGIGLGDARQLETAGAALRAEGFAVPSFMSQPTTTTWIYFDKRAGDRRIRVELVPPEPPCR